MAAWRKDGLTGAGMWFRVFGRGFHFKRGSMSFSERYGYKKFLQLPFGWRVSALDSEIF